MPLQVLYQAKLHPEQKGNSLDAEEVKRLHDALYYVCKTAVEADAESSRFPSDWLFHQRWNEKKAQPIHGNKLEFFKSAGRVSIRHALISAPSRPSPPPPSFSPCFIPSYICTIAVQMHAESSKDQAD